MALGKVGIVVAARTGSRRLPGKALLPLNGVAMILFLLERLKDLESATVVFATTELESDDHLASVVQAAGVPVYRGSAEDLVARYCGAADIFGFDTVGRVTGDCPFVDAAMVNHCLRQANNLDGFDLATTKGAFPGGLDIELYRAPVMADINALTDLAPAHREHLTLYMYERRNWFDIRQLIPPAEWGSTRHVFTVDTAEDYQAAQALAAPFAGPRFSIAAMIEKGSMTQVAVLDYGISNVGSVQNAFDFIGVQARLVQAPRELADCSHVVVPGDGSFPEGMACLQKTGLDEAVLRAVEQGKMILGICLGMQLFAEEGEEFGLNTGLGLIPGRVVQMRTHDKTLPLPQVGWNDVSLRDHSRLGGQLGGQATFYFMQSFVFSDPLASYVTAQCDYGGLHVSAVEKDNVLGVQFHPEKSQRAGLRMLKTFAALS